MCKQWPNRLSKLPYEGVVDGGVFRHLEPEDVNQAQVKRSESGITSEYKHQSARMHGTKHACMDVEPKQSKAHGVCKAAWSCEIRGKWSQSKPKSSIHRTAGRREPVDDVVA